MKSYCDQVPVYNKGTQTVEWNGRLIPFYSYCMVYQNLRRIFEFTEIFTRKPKESPKQNIVEFLIMQSVSLMRYVNDISTDVWADALDGAMALQRYLVDGDEASREEAKKYFLKIHESLCLDELFKKKPIVAEEKISDFRR